MVPVFGSCGQVDTLPFVQDSGVSGVERVATSTSEVRHRSTRVRAIRGTQSPTSALQLETVITFLDLSLNLQDNTDGSVTYTVHNQFISIVVKPEGLPMFWIYVCARSVKQESH